MKKIININLSGRVIPIEDSAYEKLQAYIESLRRYFAHEDGRDEIINDIESRIAELMNEKVRKGASCVTETDVEEIIVSMGRPEDFDAETAEATADTNTTKQNAKQEYSYSERKSRGRLYRDSSDKFIGGVCSGIANYLNTDPAIVRILFAIITFGGFGLGFLIYILLWMILPDKDLDGYSGKRLFRNPDDRVIGGVAGGLAAYFNSRASTIRLIFAAPILLSLLISFLDGLSWRGGFDLFPNIVFGSLSGTFILAYIVLWIVLPEARSPYEKMEMRGEKVDVNSIRQNVKEGMDNVKDRVKGWSEEVKESAQNFGSKAREFSNTRGRAFASEVKETARNGGRGIGHVIGVLFKVFFLFIAGTIAFALFVALIALIFGGVAWWPINNFLWTSKWQQIYAWGTLIFFLGVPLIGFITWVIRRIMRVRSRHSYLGWTFGFLWTLGWVAAILLAASITRDFREENSTNEVVNLSKPLSEKMIVAVSQRELEYTGRFGWMNDDGEGWDLSEDTLKMSMVKFDVRASMDSAYHVIVRKQGFGSTLSEAKERAEKIQYTVYSRDSILDLASGYAIDKTSKYRGQHVEIEIQVPVNKKIRFDESVTDKLNMVNFKIRKRYRKNRIVNIDIDEDYSFHFRTGVDYVMGVDGELKDPSGNKLKGNGTNYRYDGGVNEENDSIRIQQEIERKRQELKELEEKQNKRQSGRQLESMEEENEATAGILTPGFSLAKSFF
ncbi:MAG: PspC domain-containing protein [Chitinophagaceae bacterium]|nr:PspC domain-containing protein [Chitinophagaceae bacterium]